MIVYWQRLQKSCCRSVAAEAFIANKELNVVATVAKYSLQAQYSSFLLHKLFLLLQKVNHYMTVVVQLLASCGNYYLWLGTSAVLSHLIQVITQGGILHLFGLEMGYTQCCSMDLQWQSTTWCYRLLERLVSGHVAVVTAVHSSPFAEATMW